MPAFAWRLDDQEVADVVTFIRDSWGNQGKPITASEVTKLRKAAQPYKQGAP
jgi:alcohol dehydrogenase (quinone), cytochrome c subunit